MTDRATANYKAILQSPSLILAEQDTARLARPELRGAHAARVAQAGDGAWPSMRSGPRS